MRKDRKPIAIDPKNAAVTAAVAAVKTQWASEDAADALTAMAKRQSEGVQLAHGPTAPETSWRGVGVDGMTIPWPAIHAAFGCLWGSDPKRPRGFGYCDTESGATLACFALEDQCVFAFEDKSVALPWPIMRAAYDEADRFKWLGRYWAQNLSDDSEIPDNYSRIVRWLHKADIDRMTGEPVTLSAEVSLE